MLDSIFIAIIVVVVVVVSITAAATTTAVSAVFIVGMAMNVLPGRICAGRGHIFANFVYHEAEFSALGIILKALIRLMEDCWILEL